MTELMILFLWLFIFSVVCAMHNAFQEADYRELLTLNQHKLYSRLWHGFQALYRGFPLFLVWYYGLTLHLASWKLLCIISLWYANFLWVPYDVFQNYIQHRWLMYIGSKESGTGSLMDLVAGWKINWIGKLLLLILTIILTIIYSLK